MSSLPAAERAAWLNKRTDVECALLQYDWRNFWARPSQLPPPGDWRTWLILSGRGWGKTRVGAEWVRESVRQFELVNMIAATADDARDIMIQGESGILRICPDDERPIYKSSQRRLEWPNGAKSLIFTADEPERLRGKQHMRLWCLLGSTPILMADGSSKALSGVRCGDMVQTRKGPRAVAWQGMTRRNAELHRLTTMGGRVIIGTADHPVWVNGQGFVALGSLTPGGVVCAANALSGAAKSGIATVAATITRSFDFIARYGKRRMGRSRLGITSTTSTEIRATTGWRICNCCRTASTVRSMPKKSSAPIEQLRSLTQRLHKPRHMRAVVYAVSSASSAVTTFGVDHRTRRGFVRQHALRTRGLAHLAAISGHVNTAPICTPPHAEYSGTAPGAAIDWRQKPGRPRGLAVMWSARNVVRRSAVLARMRGSAADHVPLLFTDTIASVGKLVLRADVYDIAVDGESEFFANGILVHNCDEAAAWRYPEAWDQAMMGLRLGSDPRVVVTTTPRPVRIVRELMASPTTVITRGSTFDNADNLAPAFMQQIISRYENTRLGQQELLGMVLDDTPGSLWNRNQIVYRDARVASMQRIVVAIDPAVTSDPEKSDETGIIVAGRGIDGNAYIFEDLSCILSPEGWAGRAVNAYREFGADRIVAEVNNGGDLVEMVIRTHDRSVSYKAVHASRGKRVRAEPIAALYEQGKVFHTKAFPTLEDQQCAFVPDNYDGSPDRVDALVWALTELMLSPGRPFTVAVGAARNEAIWNYKPR